MDRKGGTYIDHSAEVCLLLAELVGVRQVAQEQKLFVNALVLGSSDGVRSSELVTGRRPDNLSLRWLGLYHYR